MHGVTGFIVTKRGRGGGGGRRACGDSTARRSPRVFEERFSAHAWRSNYLQLYWRLLPARQRAAPDAGWPD